MIISIIVAMDENRGVGKGNRIPWQISDDLKRFKNITMGHHLIMGRKTFDSIGRILPGRTSIVLTRNLANLSNNPSDKLRWARSLAQALAIARAAHESEVFIIGGGKIFEQALPHTDRIYLTLVHATVDCDTFFPQLDPNQWLSTEESFSASSEKNQYTSTFKVFTHR